MRLAVISNVKGCHWAGSETVWHAAAMRALKEGHAVTAILHPDLLTASQIAEFSQAGGSVWNWHSFPVARFQSIKEKVIPSFPAKSLRQFDAILVSLGSLPAINYVPGLVEGLLKAGTAFVFFCQFNADHLPISPTERTVVMRMLASSAACVFVSHRNMLEARRQYAMEMPNAQVILNSASATLEVPSPWPDESQFVSFASVARFETAWKGQDLLLEVLSGPQWHERNWQLRFYGTGPDFDHVRRLSTFLKLDERVTFEGFVSDLRSIWLRNHVLLMPSHGEGTPLAMLEAMMHGRPVVATDVGGNAEIIEDGVTGFIAEAATARSFSKAMERLWKGRDRWQEMGTIAHECARQRASANPTGTLLDTWKAAGAG